MSADDSTNSILPGIRIAPDAIRFQYARSSGPGGQNVNKVNTKAELWVAVNAIEGLTDRAHERLVQLAGKRLTLAGEIHIAADTERTQESNRQAVIDRLRLLLQTAVHEPRKRKKTRPSKASRQRRLDGKRQRSEIKQGRRSAPGHD